VFSFRRRQQTLRQQVVFYSVPTIVMGAFYLLYDTDTYRAGLLGHILFCPRDQVFHPSGRPMRLNSSAVRV